MKKLTWNGNVAPVVFLNLFSRMKTSKNAKNVETRQCLVSTDSFKNNVDVFPGIARILFKSLSCYIFLFGIILTELLFAVPGIANTDIITDNAVRDAKNAHVRQQELFHDENDPLNPDREHLRQRQGKSAGEPHTWREEMYKHKGERNVRDGNRMGYPDYDTFRNRGMTNNKNIINTADSDTWKIEVVVGVVGSIGDVGRYTSIAVDTFGKVHISYFDGANFNLKYATNVSGSWVTTTVDSNLGYDGGYTSIAVDTSGNVHISYFDDTNQDLKYATNGSGSWVTTTVDSGGFVGWFTSIALDTLGKVHISYLDYTNGDLKYATNGSGSWVTTTVDSGGFVGIGTSIAVDTSGNVHICCLRYDNYFSKVSLRYATNGSGSWVTTTVDSGDLGVNSVYSSIAVDTSGNVHISYYDATNSYDGDIKYATNASGSWVTTAVDSSRFGGWYDTYNSIAVDTSGNAHISYFDNTNQDLKYATNASDSWVTTTVDSDGYVGYGTSIAVDASGTVHIGYYDRNNNNIDLKHAELQNAFAIQLGHEVCNDGIDNDSDGLVDCKDPDCCGNETCTEKVCSESSLTETIRGQNAVMNDGVISGDFASTINFKNLEFVTITTGAFAGKGFFRGGYETTLEDVTYKGKWKGVFYLKPDEKKIYLKGAITGEIEATVEGALTESSSGSGIYDGCQAVWKIGSMKGSITTAIINIHGIINYLYSSEFSGTELSVLQTQIERTISVDAAAVGPLSIVSTHLRIDSEDNPYKGEGFSHITYTSESGSGEAWTYDRVASSEWVVMKGLCTGPFYGIASGIIATKTLFLNIEKVDKGLPPMSNLEVVTWGPQRVSPGQTVDYLVEYRNDGEKEAKNVVVVARLPQEVDYISGTNGGIYKWETHEVIWKLGTVSPKNKGNLSVKVMVKWGVPAHAQLTYYALIGTTSNEKDVYKTKISIIDPINYLEYQPPKPPIIENFNTADKLPELLQDSQFADLYNDAIEKGFEPGESIIKISNDDDSNMITIVMVKDKANLLINKYTNSEKITTYFITETNEDSFVMHDQTKGLKISSNGSFNTWGEFISSQDAADCILGACFTHCITGGFVKYFITSDIKSLIKFFSGKVVGDIISCMLKFVDGLPGECKSGDMSTCTLKLYQKILSCMLPFIETSKGLKPSTLAGWASLVATIIDCTSDCAKKGGPPLLPNPLGFWCVPGKERHECGGFLSWRRVFKCNNNCQWELKEKEECRSKDCPGGWCYENVDLTSAECVRPTNCNSKPPNSGSGNSENINAHDPNIKYGPEGAISAGQKLDYKVEFENEGEGIAYGVYFTDTLDEDLDDSTLVIGPVKEVKTDDVIAAQGKYDLKTRTITWFVGEVGSRKGGYAEISVNVKNDAPKGTEVINYGTVYFPSVPEVTRTNAIVSKIPDKEICGNGIDDDGDDLIDCEDPDCFSKDCQEVCDDGMDNDGDGFVDCADMDCDPCPEDCSNGIDDDRDGLVDCDDPDCDCPVGCTAEQIAIHPARLVIKRKTSDEVGITVHGDENCPVAGQPVTVKLSKGAQKRLVVVPMNMVTDANGQTTFTITAKNKAGNGRIFFKVGEVNVSLLVRVTK